MGYEFRKLPRATAELSGHARDPYKSRRAPAMTYDPSSPEPMRDQTGWIG